MLGRIPARSQRQCDRKCGAGEAEQDAEREQAFVSIEPAQPRPCECTQHDDLADGAGLFRLEVIDQYAHDNAQHGAGEQGRGHHQTLLHRRQSEIGRDLHGQRTEQHPDHEAHVKVEEGRQQRGKVSRLEEVPTDQNAS